MKLKYLIFVMLLVSGCVYDPPSGFITVVNNSDSTVYVRVSDTNYIRSDYPMKTFAINNDMLDEDGNKLDSIVYPEYRARPHSNAYLHGFGTPREKQIPHNKDTVYLFFIDESTLKSQSWGDISNKQIYKKKMSFSKQGLDSLHWTVVY